MRELIIKYIKNNSNASLNEIRNNLKTNPLNYFRSIKEIYKEAGVDYPRDTKKLREKKRHLIINLIRKNPQITGDEIMVELKTKPYRLFKSIKEMYKLAGVDYIDPGRRISLKKKEEVIELIKKNPTITQWEINKLSKTHIQEIFKGGIRKAYELAGIKYPKGRLLLYGAANKKIRKRAKEFEDSIYAVLNKLGRVCRQVKSKSGIADFIVEIKGSKIVVEVKNYTAKPITKSEVKQLYNYMCDNKIKDGWLVCLIKPKKDKFYINNKTIKILTRDQLGDVS